MSFSLIALISILVAILSIGLYRWHLPRRDGGSLRIRPHQEIYALLDEITGTVEVRERRFALLENLRVEIWAVYAPGRRFNMQKALYKHEAVLEGGDFENGPVRSGRVRFRVRVLPPGTTEFDGLDRSLYALLHSPASFRSGVNWHLVAFDRSPFGTQVGYVFVPMYGFARRDSEMGRLYFSHDQMLEELSRS